jgi:hypothetical protein
MDNRGMEPDDVGYKVGRSGVRGRRGTAVRSYYYTTTITTVLFKRTCCINVRPAGD